jgi:hypothetical protein
MSCTSCNKSNCSCSDNCPNKASDITVFDCDSLNVIEVPCDASLCDVIGLLEAYTTNMVNELSEMTSVVIGANCLGLDPGTYSVQQIIPLLIDSVCITVEENCSGLEPGTYTIQEIITLLLNDCLTVEDTTTINLDYTSNVLTAKIQDTGWVDLVGFDFLSGAAFKPQCRRIGNEVLFRGTVIVPMGNAGQGASGVVVPHPGADTYGTLLYGKTFNTVNSSNAANSCKLYTHGNSVWTGSGLAISLRFNLGNSIIPAGILNPGQTFDGSYTTGNREIVLRNVTTAEGKNVNISSVVITSIDANGVLGLFPITYTELFNSSTSGYEYSSAFRNLVSNIIAGEQIPLFTPAAPSLYNAPGVGVYEPQLTGANDTWTFNQNAGRADELGGFLVSLNGLRTFVSPCGDVIPTPDPC